MDTVAVHLQAAGRDALVPPHAAGWGFPGNWQCLTCRRAGEGALRRNGHAAPRKAVRCALGNESTFPDQYRVANANGDWRATAPARAAGAVAADSVQGAVGRCP